MSRLDMVEKPAKANIQGFEKLIVKINNKGHMPTALEGGETIMGGEAASPTTPRRAALASARSKYAVRLKYVTTVDNKCTSAWPPDRPKYSL